MFFCESDSHLYKIFIGTICYILVANTSCLHNCSPHTHVEPALVEVFIEKEYMHCCQFSILRARHYPLEYSVCGPGESR
jgi:hypothetical protein